MKRTAPTLYFFLTLALTAAFVILRTSMLLGGYDLAGGFYTDARWHAVLKYGLAAFAVLCFVFGCISYNKKEENCPFRLPQNTVTDIASILAGASLIGYVLYSFTLFAVWGQLKLADVLLDIFALIGSAYYLSERQYKGKAAEFRALLCSSAALTLLVIVFSLYFDSTVSFVNHSIKLTFAAAVFLMLTLIAEAGASIGRTDVRKKFFCYAPTAVLLSMTLALPDLIAAAVYRQALIADLYYDILILALGLHQMARLGAAAFTKEN